MDCEGPGLGITYHLPNSGRGGGKWGGPRSSLPTLQDKFRVELLELVHALLLEYKSSPYFMEMKFNGMSPEIRFA
jgi:hypothetical protein